MRSLVLILVAFTSLSTFAAESVVRPGPQEGHIYLNGAVALYSPANDLFTENPLGPALTIGYGLSDRWALEFMYSQFNVDYSQGVISGSDTTRLGWLDLLYEFQGDERWQPFLVFGAGRADAGRGSLGDVDETQMNLGVGLFRAINDRFSLRGDLRAVYSDAERSLEPFASLGVTALLGSLSRAESVAAIPVDSDSDGVADSQDSCPDTATGVVVDQFGCELDDDRDGVVNSLDACPDTPSGAKVDARGCAVELEELVTIDLALEFDSNSASLRPEHAEEIEKAVQFLRSYPNAAAVIEGHTDSDGAAGYNLQLSEQRARAVLDFMVQQRGISVDRLSAVGYGESRPVGPNDTTLGKQANRRVAVVVSGSESVVQKRDE